MSDTFSTVDEFATRLSITRETVYSMIADGLPHLRLGSGPRGQIRIPEERALVWLEGRKGTAAPK